MWMESLMLFPAPSPALNVLPKGALEARPVADKGLQGPGRRQGCRSPSRGPTGREKIDQTLASLRCLPARVHAHTHTSQHIYLCILKTH